MQQVPFSHGTPSQQSAFETQRPPGGEHAHAPPRQASLRQSTDVPQHDPVRFAHVPWCPQARPLQQCEALLHCWREQVGTATQADASNGAASTKVAPSGPEPASAPAATPVARPPHRTEAADARTVRTVAHCLAWKLWTSSARLPDLTGRATYAPFPVRRRSPRRARRSCGRRVSR